MKKVLNYTFAISLGLLLLIMIEGLATLGDAFKFEEYSIIGWIAQILGVIFTITASILITDESTNNKL
jgi:hypothetical protein